MLHWKAMSSLVKNKTIWPIINTKQKPRWQIVRKENSFPAMFSNMMLETLNTLFFVANLDLKSVVKPQYNILIVFF